MSKKWLSFLCIVTITCTSFAQEKIKGNKNVTTIETKIDEFNTIDFGEKFEIELIESDSPSVEIETDENLHDVIRFSVKDNVLKFKTTAKIQSSKRLNITVFYTSALHKIEVSEDAEISATNTIKNDSLELQIKDYARAFLNIENQYFKLINNNKSTFGISSKSKLNIESKTVTLELDENSKTEALIETDSLYVDMYKRAYAKIEGDVDYLTLTTINASDFSAKNLSINTCIVTTEDSSDATIQVIDEVTIETSGSSEIYLYGDPKITINNFKDTSSIHKKEL
ncbi:GIN domain-containing protein [Lacinutrix iliipiscaria]|uniref:GIN domain-containing protein n=1 Tax=Lacinutrix iliipiscaria TaxID=1230532 RepID=A0ABW5WNI3_9FLAO